MLKKSISLILSLLLICSSFAAYAADDVAGATTHTIALIANGSGVLNCSHINAEPGTVITITASPNNGHAFYMWTSAPSVNFVDYSCPITTFVMPDYDVYITATFVANAIVDEAGASSNPGAIKDHFITFHTQGGSHVDRISVANGAIATEPTPPTCDGYIFAGWTTDAFGNNPFPFHTTPITQSYDLYAQWKPLSSGSLFTDLGNHGWAKDAIARLVSKGIVNGTSATTFAPAKNITRADFITLIVRAFGFRASFTENFSDVPASAYYYNAVGIAKELGIASGSGANKFNPTAPITRQDIMVIIDRAAKKAGVTLTPISYPTFSDTADVSAYAKDAVALLTQSGIVTGAGDKINPKKYATRAEVAVILDRLLNK